MAVYFAQPVAGGPIKIGCSANVAARVRTLSSYYGQPFAILATVDGDYETEKQLHQKFAHLRLGRTEQFRPEAELLAFIARPLFAATTGQPVEAVQPRKVLDRPGRLTRAEGGRRIKEARKAAGMTQGQAAAKMGMKQPSFAQYELGRRDPSILQVFKMIEVLGLDPAILFPEFRPKP